MAETILYEMAAPNVARIVLNRPETRNAQDTRLLYELNDAYERATQDEAVKVIITAANGPHFSSGHDLREQGHLDTQDKYKPVTSATGYRRAGAEGRQAREEEIVVNANSGLIRAQQAVYRKAGLDPILWPRLAGSWPGYIFTGDPLNLPAGHFGLGHGNGAHAPNEYYVIESANPKVHGIAGAIRAQVDYLYELAV